MVIRPTTLDVVVHPPIPTDTWTRDDLDERIAEIEELYRETLES